MSRRFFYVRVNVAQTVQFSFPTSAYIGLGFKVVVPRPLHVDVTSVWGCWRPALLQMSSWSLFRGATRTVLGLQMIVDKIGFYVIVYSIMPEISCL